MDAPEKRPARFVLTQNWVPGLQKNDRENQEDYDPDVRVIEVASNLQRQHKKPRDPSSSNQKDANHLPVNTKLAQKNRQPNAIRP
jgi:hypothetical protein